MTYRILYFDFREDSTVVERDEECVADGAFGWVMVVDRETLVLDAVYLGAEGVDAGVGGGCVCAAVISINIRW
jgi:hypothetical protein